MSSGTLYTYTGSFRAYKILVAAQYSGATVKTVSDPPEFVFGETNKTNDFLKKFPLGKVPAFETSDGTNIFESNAIAYYVGNEQLRGQNVADQTSILQWINFADNEILPASCNWVFPILGIRPLIKKDADRAKEDVTKALTLLNDHLLTRTFLVGERITQADITVSCNLLLLYEHILDPATREPFANTNRWFTTVISQPQFKAVVGEFKLCEKTAEFDAKKFAEFQGKTGKETKDKKEKSPKPTKSGDEAPAKAKESKPKGKDAKSEDPPEELDETEQILAAESSSSDPFDQLPKGTFDMNDFKRVYSNESETVSIPYFWEKLDKENYSIWQCEYKYPEDLTLVFMSCNLISGLYQRLDKMRKQSFGSMILFGKDNESTISGVWVWRGQGLAFELSPDWQVDYEHYNWKKLDPNSDADKKVVTEYFSWSGDFDGKTFNQGKIFK